MADDDPFEESGGKNKMSRQRWRSIKITLLRYVELQKESLREKQKKEKMMLIKSFKK